MATETTPPCANCPRLQAEVDASRAELDALRAVVAPLQRPRAAARKDPSNSSKPPSSDLVKPPKPPPPPGPQRREPGGQPGHASHRRVPLPPERLAATPTDSLRDACPACGGHLPVTDAEPVVAQRVEIAAGPLEAHEHRRQPGWCPQGRQGCYAPFPLSIGRGGLAGPRRTTVLASLKGACHASDPTIREYVRDVIGLTISRGQPAKILGEVSRAPERPDEERLGDPPDQAVLDVDEAGHKRNGQQHWTWCSRAGLDTWFKIDPTGGADVLIDVLGSEFDGVLGRDSASAYRRSHRESGVALRFGLAPLSREVKDLTTLPDARDRADGEGLRQAWRGPVAVIHRRGEWTEAESQRRLGVARDEVLWRGTSDVPTTRAAGNPAKRLEAHGAS